MQYVVKTSKKNGKVINNYYIVPNLETESGKEYNKNSFATIYKKGEFFTATKNKDGKYVKGDEIEKIDSTTEIGKYYFRTKGNTTEEDNLGELPLI